MQFESDGNSFLSFGSHQVKKVSLDGLEAETIYKGISPYYSSFPFPTNEIIKKGKKIFYNNRSEDGTYNRYQKEYLPNLKLIGFLDLEKSETTNFLSFPDQSLSQNGLIFPHSNWASHFIFSKSELIVVFQGEPALFVFEGEEPFTFIQKIDLDLGEFKIYPGNPEGEEGMDILDARTTLGSIECIEKINEFILIGYNQGFSEKQIRNLENASTPQEKGKIIRKFEGENSSRIQLLDENFQVLDDFIKPKYLKISSLMVRDGHLWGSKFDPDTEDDFFTINKLEVREK